MKPTRRQLNRVKAKPPGARCEDCPLLERGGPVLGSGPPLNGGASAHLIVIGHAPGAEEMVQGVPFVGQNGAISDTLLEEAGLTHDEVWHTNLVACRSLTARGEDTPPPPAAIEACSGRLARELNRVPTGVGVVTVGEATARHVLGTGGPPLNKAEGATFWSDLLSRWVIPTYQPLYTLRGGGDAAASAISDAYRRGSTLRAVGGPDRTLEDDPPYYYANTPETAHVALTHLETHPDTYALDTETEYAGDPHYRLLTVQIANAERAWVFDTPALADAAVQARLGRLLAGGRWIIHNSVFDLQYLTRWFGASVLRGHYEDTLALALCIHENASSIGLKSLSRRYLGAGFYETSVDEAKIGPTRPMSTLDRDELVKYGALDAIYTRRLWSTLDNLVQGQSRSLYEQILRPTQRTFADMETNGVLINRERVADLRETLLTSIERLDATLQEVATEAGFDPRKCVKNPKSATFNPYSPVQRKHLFYDLLGLNKAYEAGRLTTGAEFYKANPDSEAAEAARDLTHLKKMLSVYVDGIVGWMHPDGRVRPSYRLWGARTGRISVVNPPLQTIPHDHTFGAGLSIKRIFEAAPGYTFVDADYTALELYIAYELSGDPTILKELQAGDFHRRAASASFNTPYEEVTEKQRVDSKRVTYGAMYNITGHGLSKLLDGDVDTNEERLRRWLEGFPVFAEWRAGIQKRALETGLLTTSTGRQRRWLIRTPANRQEILGQASNFPIQSIANDVCLMALNDLNSTLKASGLGYVILTVHDSIVCEIKSDHLAEGVHLIWDAMTKPRLNGRLESHPIEIKTGQNWGDTKLWSP